jgi:23S rRNA (pseudouridine1915-N3)-methyltransferase
MLQVFILMAGKTREGFIREGLAFYQKRLQPFLKLSLQSVKEEKEGGGLSPETLKWREGERLKAQLPQSLCSGAGSPRKGINFGRFRGMAG